MKQIGKLFNQPLLVVVMVMLVVALAVPYSASAMLALETEDFNTCSALPAGWTLENPSSITHPVEATAVVKGGFTGEAYLELSMNAVYASLTNGNVLAPRLVTPITDEDFEIEIKYLAPQINTGAGSMIQGVVFRDETTGGVMDWLRIDFNSSNNVINAYIGYLQSDDVGYVDQSQQNIVAVTPLEGGPTTTGPILLRVKYVQTTGAWTVTYTMNGENTVFEFDETDFATGFTPDHMGLWIATGSTNQQAHTSRVDYVRLTSDPVTVDDAAKVTVNIVGNGDVTQTACPVGVAGDVVRLQAVANPGATFTGWSGDATGSTNPLDVTVNAPKTITATFTGGVELDEKLYLPIIH